MLRGKRSGRLICVICNRLASSVRIHCAYHHSLRVKYFSLFIFGTLRRCGDLDTRNHRRFAAAASDRNNNLRRHAIPFDDDRRIFHCKRAVRLHCIICHSFPASVRIHCIDYHPLRIEGFALHIVRKVGGMRDFQSRNLRLFRLIRRPEAALGRYSYIACAVRRLRVPGITLSRFQPAHMIFYRFISGGRNRSDLFRGVCRNAEC